MKKNVGFIMAIVLMLCFVMVCDSFAWIEMKALSQVESSGNVQKYNKKTKATGEYQITPICLKDFNKETGNKFKQKDLFDTKLNVRIAKWYLFTRIPQLLKAKGINNPTDEQILAHYGGYKSVKDAKEYLNKYKKAAAKIKPIRRKPRKKNSIQNKNQKRQSKKSKFNSGRKSAKKVNTPLRRSNSYVKKVDNSSNVLEFKGKVEISGNTRHKVCIILEDN